MSNRAWGRGSTWLSSCSMRPGRRMSLAVGLGPDARCWPREGGGTGASFLIYLLPWHSPWVGAPPRAGTDGVPGSQQCLSSLGHPPGKIAFVTNPGSHKGRDLEKLRPSRVVGAEGSWFCVSVRRLCSSLISSPVCSSHPVPSPFHQQHPLREASLD